MDKFEEIFKDVKNVLAVFAHPDDLEVFSGGLVKRLVDSGRRVRSVKVTNGNKGSRNNVIDAVQLTQMRRREDSISMQVLGIKPEDSVFLDIGDGEVENDFTTIGKIAYQIREFKPDLIITHNPEDVIIKFNDNNHWVNHRDHRNVGQSTIDAAYPYSRDTLFYPEHLERLDSHIVVKLLMVDYYSDEDTISFDITDVKDTKVRSLESHGSQFTIGKGAEMIEFMNRESDGRYREKYRYIRID